MSELDRLKHLAGIDNNIERQLAESIEEMALLEKEYESKHGVKVDTKQMSVTHIEKMMAAATKALGIANRLKNVADKKKHMSRVMSNMNTIRAALQTAIKEMGDE